MATVPGRLPGSAMGTSCRGVSRGQICLRFSSAAVRLKAVRFELIRSLEE